MLDDDLKKYPKAIWVHFYKNRMMLMAIDGTTKAIEIPQIPYHHPRMILADFENATATLKALMKHHTQGSSFFKLTAPIAIVQIMEPIPDHLTKIEIRAFQELFWNTGARKIKLYDIDGNPIGNEE